MSKYINSILKIIKQEPKSAHCLLSIFNYSKGRRLPCSGIDIFDNDTINCDECCFNNEQFGPTGIKIIRILETTSDKTK